MGIRLPAARSPAVVVCEGGASPAEALAAMHAASPPGYGLLHLAASARSPSVLRELGAWAGSHGLEWALEAPAANGLTPLHVAAVLRDGGRVRDALLGGWVWVGGCAWVGMGG